MQYQPCCVDFFSYTCPPKYTCLPNSILAHLSILALPKINAHLSTLAYLIVHLPTLALPSARHEASQWRWQQPQDLLLGGRALHLLDPPTWGEIIGQPSHLGNYWLTLPPGGKLLVNPPTWGEIIG